MTGPERHGGLADVLDDHLAAEFASRDLDATMATMTGDPYLNRVPVLTGGIGRDEVRRFYQQVFIGHWPADTTRQRISRTVGTDQVVDELVMSFTHGIAMNHLLPGVPPHREASTAGGVRGSRLPGRQAQPRAHLLGSSLAAGPGGTAGPGGAARG